MKIEQLSDEELLASTKRLATREREARAALDRLLQEVDARQPGLRQDWPRRIDDCGAHNQGVRAIPKRRGPRA